MAYDEKLAARIRRTLQNRSDVIERKMFGGLAFLRNGRMCCGIVGNDLVVRVLPDETEAALHRPYVRPMDFTGRPMRGFVYVSQAGCGTTATLRYWIDHGLRFVGGLKPKAPGRSTRARSRAR